MTSSRRLSSLNRLSSVGTRGPLPAAAARPGRVDAAAPVDGDAGRKGVLLDRDSADALREVRWSRGLSLETCAAALGVTVPEYLAKERGRKPFSGRELRALLTKLGIDETDLRGASWSV